MRRKHNVNVKAVDGLAVYSLRVLHCHLIVNDKTASDGDCSGIPSVV
jgi:hypothetical protein